MDRDTIKKIILEYREFISEVKLISRKYTIEPGANYVIAGPRRAGKTYLLYQVIQEQFMDKETKQQAVYINFEDERLMEMKTADLDSIISVHRELSNLQPVFFFDEIHIVPGWEKFLRRLADQKYRIFVTGSNARIQSSDIASVLGGRFLIIEVHTLSFPEYLSFNEVTPEKNYEHSKQRFQIFSLFRSYLHYGAFPEAIFLEDKKAYLRNLFQKVYYGDIITRYKIRNDFALKLLTKKIAESITDETSFNRIKNLIKSTGIDVGTATLIDYFSYLEDGFLVCSITNFGLKFTERETYKKFYYADTGFLGLFLLDADEKLLENLVHTELRRRYRDDIFYYRGKRETDFYLPGKGMAIQVSYSISNPDTYKREVDSLVSCLKTFNLDKGYILTYDEEDEIVNHPYTIKVVPVWKWLMKK